MSGAMVLVRRGVVDVDIDRAGAGPLVLLLGGVDCDRQWPGLADALADRYRVVTVALHGRGATPPWPRDRRQTLADQVRLVHALTAGRDERIALVGHAVSGAVALRAAVELDERVAAVVVFEPLAFTVLPKAGRTEDWATVLTQRDQLRAAMGAGRPEEAARLSTGFLVGPDAWDRLSPEARTRGVEGIVHRLGEWDAITDPAVTLADVASGPAPTLLAVDPGTIPAVRSVADVLTEARPDWDRAEIPGAGHWAPVDRPDVVIPLVSGFLDRHLRP